MGYLISFEKEENSIRFIRYELYRENVEKNHYFHFIGTEATKIVRMLFVIGEKSGLTNVSIEKKAKDGGAIVIRVREEKELKEYETFFSTLLEKNQEKMTKLLEKLQIKLLYKDVDLEKFLEKWA